MNTDTVRPRHPDRLCDLVMKGGITSGIAYPEAIGALKDRYRFRNIGGASAGAIAAAATAAAEYGRDSGGFDHLTGLAEELSEDNALRSLFQPTRAARPAFNLLLRLQQDRSKDRVAGGVGRVVTAVLALARGLWWWPLLGAAAGALLVWAASDGAALFSPWPRAVALVVAMVVGAALGLAAGTAVRARTLVTSHLPKSFYGMCTGMTQDGTDTVALTPWLHHKLQQMAGRADGDKPVTFADLRTVDLPIEIDEDAGEVPGVRLEMMTTDVTLARPLRLPFTGDTQYYFSPAEFDLLFPPEVMRHMNAVSTSDIAHGRVPDGDDTVPSDLRKMPHEELPIIVATRMSLSFPVLLSAVPLYTYRPTGTPHWVRHWLSDGGIGSNFPIHFFDSLVPRWPTFALRFIPATVRDQDGDQVHDRDDAWSDEERRYRPEAAPVARRGQIGSLGGFLSAILDTMQNWRDTLQSELPGFRDRIEDIALASDEGGMNLTMERATIERVRSKGKSAGERLVTDFRWNSHQFLRYAMTMRLLDDTLGPKQLARAYRFEGFDEKICRDINTVAEELRATGLERFAADLEQRYPPAWCHWASQRTVDLLDQVAQWGNETNGETFSGEPTPRPPSVLRVGPPV